MTVDHNNVHFKSHVKLVVDDYKRRTKGSLKYLTPDLRFSILWACVGSLIVAQSDSETSGNAAYFDAIFTAARGKLGLDY